MKNVLELLEKTAEREPDGLACADLSTRLSWCELRDTARKIGTGLADVMTKGQPVVVLAEKSVFTLATQFGAVYAGGFYVPVSKDQPQSRIQDILKRLGSSIIVTDTDGSDLKELAAYTERILTFTDLRSFDVIDEVKLDTIRQAASDSDLLYGIFTSGSSGTPKCVSVQHRSVLDFIGHFTEIFGIRKEDRIANQAPFDFDVSVKDIYSALATGAGLILIDRRYFSMPAKLIDLLIDEKVTVLIWAVSALTTVSVLGGLDYKVPSNLRMIMFSGEVMPTKRLREWQSVLPETDFINLYGPSEITCNCTYFRIDHMPEEGEGLPIGKAFPGRRVFLLNEEKQLVTEPDVAGELCVAGESLAAGYYHDPEKTAEHFMTYHLDGEDVRIYTTGDLAHYNAEGDLVFEGRKDFQIKHMGHRIELEEIEAHLERQDGVTDCCCIFDSLNKRIAAFYTGDVNEKDLRKMLKGSLPVYMIPKKFLHLTQIPLNKNGKKDRNALRQML